jgi:hypothetical protein
MLLLRSHSRTVLLALLLLGGCHFTNGYVQAPSRRTPPPPLLPPSVAQTSGAPNTTGSLQADAPTHRDIGAPPQCATNDDCVRATCCHANACVPRGQAPHCSDVMCTMDCRPNTLDCGGRCACEGGLCVAHLARP